MKTCTRCTVAKTPELFHRDHRVANGRSPVCIECRRVEKTAWREANRERTRAYQRAYAAQNPERVKAAKLTYFEANKTKAMAAVRKWQAENPHARNAATAHRYARKKQATPVWACPFIIEWYYYDARWMTKATGVLHHVDHFYPLRGKTVSGLHCEDNMQVIPAVVNHAKNRKMPEEP